MTRVAGFGDEGEVDSVLIQTESRESQLMRTLSQDQRDKTLAAFLRTNSLSHKADVFEKAAALLKGDGTVEDIANVTENELDALRKESESKWSQPGALYFTIAMCSFGAIEQGMAQTSMNGANLYYPKVFGIDSGSTHDVVIVGFINSGIYLSCAAIGAWLSEPVNNRLGRRGAIFAGSVICLLFSITSALSQSWQMLAASRVILGAGLGINVSSISIFTAESAPSYIRGGLAVSWQMFVAFGVFLGFAANLSVYNITSPWRLQLGFPLLPTIPLIALIYFCPESPAWIIKRKRRYDLAFQSLQRLRNTELQAARDVLQFFHEEQAKGSKGRASFVQKLLELFTVPRLRRASMAAYTVMLAQILCGINIIAFYSSTIFVNAGFSTFAALLASVVFGLVNFLGAFPAIWTMDTLGRRTLLLLTLPFMAVTMLLAGFSFALPSDSSAHLWLLATMIYLFCALYSPGMGPVPVSYSAECFPLSHREMGMSFAVSTANSWASLVALTFPGLLEALKPLGTFSLYAGLNLFSFILVFLFVYETRMKTLDELDEVFSIPTRQFIQYQITEYIPWWTKTYLLRRNDADLKELDSAPVVYSQIQQEEELES